MSKSPLLNDVKAVFLDMDGTIYHGGTLYPTTMPFLDFLKSRKIPYAFCSNNSSYSKDEYVARLAKYGIKTSKENFYTSVDFLVDTLRAEHPEWKRLYLLGVPAMKAEMEEAGYEIVDENPEAVIVSFDKTLTYKRLCEASWFIYNGVPGFSTHPDVFCPTDQPTRLVDCGAISRCVELATGKTLRQLGKPDAGFLQRAAARFDAAKRELGIAYFPHASVGWDDNPRYPKEVKRPIVVGSTPEKFEKVLRRAKDWIDANPQPGMPKLVTVNSWNEWTEMSYLEPDDVWGYGYLEAVRDVFGSRGESHET